ncbi:MAG: lipoyl synthase [Bacteroidales bacterium]|nr:lipoyl synthase [Bacteroidales bacterium]
MSIRTDNYRLPKWMTVPLPHGSEYTRVKNLISEHNLHTICSSGNCPNKSECWSAGTATFMILGEKCTRNCRFCFVKALVPDPVDWDEPARVANTIKTLKLKHCVITSVARDDLEDQGASFWAYCIRTIKEVNKGITMEVLIPDLGGKKELLDIIINEKPEIISHNIETVERISPKIRSQATYANSLAVLKHISTSRLIVKSGFMLGLGEFEEEVLKTMADLKQAGVQVLTIGQYLPPSEMHAKLVEYIKPEIFEKYKKAGLEMGFKYIESGPLIRSSYHSEKHVNI